MSILLVSIGDVDLKIIQILKDDLKRVFSKPVEIGKALSEPHCTDNKITLRFLLTHIEKMSVIQWFGAKMS